MDSQASTAKRDLECMLFDESMEAKALPLSLLKCITNDFSDNLEIGRGGSAVVYKGLLENGEVAVKKLSQTSHIDDMKFHVEVDCLMKAKHKNIVRFLGYCSDTQGQIEKHNGKSVMAEVRQRLLCFEYHLNGSLYEYIKDASREWGKCYQIIKGVCEGLQYLHKERIVHLDLKPANVLLDNDMVPKITDFGISRCFDEKQTHLVTSKIVGTAGYLAPEFFYGKLSFKSDIFSLGVIIIEILTSKKDYPDVKDVLERWRHKVEQSQKEQQLEQIRVCTKLGQRCLDYDPAKRPSINSVINVLEQTEIKKLRIETGASSSTALQASLVAVEKTSIDNFRMEADPKTVATTFKMVTQAICEFYAQGRTNVSLEDLHRGAYNMVLYKKVEELYSVMEDAMALEVQILCSPLDAAPVDSTAFLQRLLAMWKHHIRAVNFIRQYISMYIERTFITTNHKTPIYELGLRLWRDNIARSDKIRPRLIEAVKRRRGGEDELVAGVNEMLTELGAEVMNVPCLCFRDGAGKLHAAGP
ncbi:unnamed protein product [Urochloa decumbens]|uniref:Protein kinase domain-containing protein n=1 Tax=Urochloa decumbens TaxID=240449 RepID=A0ABC9EMV8_9POAL